MSCETCFLYKRAFPFDRKKGECEFNWGWCIQLWGYIDSINHPGKLLKLIKNKLEYHSQQLTPVDENKYEHTWHGDYKWRPYDFNHCPHYLPVELGIIMLNQELDNFQKVIENGKK